MSISQQISADSSPPVVSPPGTPTRALVGSPAVTRWLWTVFGMIFVMVIVGGITRLTGSGLSMVEWRPLMGALPPLSETEWLAVFDQYKTSPQYAHVNHWMTLGDFKSIFFWEYLHRLLGRLIGVVFALPWVYFLVRKRMNRPLFWRTFGIFLLGGLQGLMGWYMVMSGLVDRPEVSHLRLAAHLSLALLVALACLWLIFNLRTPQQATPGPRPMPPEAPPEPPAISARSTWLLLGLIALQVIYGAFMAGTRAGTLAPDFPLMNGEWVPAAAFATDGLLGDITSNPWSIHFIHRTLGWLALLTGLWLGYRLLRGGTDSRQRLAGRLLFFGIATQFLLGVMTVMMHVPIVVAVSHQGGAVLLLSISLYACYAVKMARTR